ncbi:MAG: hypothetical protein JRI25_22180 [Deltaproteobacteria bacterium]|nr:hypothetical protein [Deltaproteobacteria bacterium]
MDDPHGERQTVPGDLQGGGPDHRKQDELDRWGGRGRQPLAGQDHRAGQDRRAAEGRRGEGGSSSSWVRYAFVRWRGDGTVLRAP